MAGKESGKSQLGRLVVFMFCLAIAGTFVAGVHYVAVDLPAQKNLQAPENGIISQPGCIICIQNCGSPDIGASDYNEKYFDCYDMCDMNCYTPQQ